MRDGLRPAEREALYAPDRRMDAYYFGFDSTGVPEVDAILSAVACAGKSYHHTDEWGGGESRFGEDRPYADVIQAAANEAANRWDHTAAIAEAAREMVAVINAAEAAGNANPLMGDAARIRWHDRIVVAEQRLFAAVDAERAGREGDRRKTGTEGDST